LVFYSFSSEREREHPPQGKKMKLPNQRRVFFFLNMHHFLFVLFRHTQKIPHRREKKQGEFARYRAHKGKHKQVNEPPHRQKILVSHQAQNLLLKFLVFVRH
jgi:hypothetical protein